MYLNIKILNVNLSFNEITKNFLNIIQHFLENKQILQQKIYIYFEQFTKNKHLKSVVNYIFSIIYKKYILGLFLYFKNQWSIIGALTSIYTI